MVVLATKLYVEGDARERSLDSLRSLVANALGDLDVTYEVGVRHDDFPSVTVEGDDAVVARNLLREEWGEITGEFEAGETYVGTLERWDEDGFVLDAGEAVRIPADEIDLGPGSPAQVRERFGLVQHLPMRFVYGGENEPNRLADEERDRLYDWTRGDGRVNVNSATRGEVRATVNRAGHAQDIVTVERLGLLEQSIVCTESTDPPGLLASIGQYLPAELRAVVP
ncbi:DUF2110 family protein [Halostella sp. JP-L12]|uniref:DUF2110 family protein n=1 Tax=Halostella TaxID=1843185 RepID=UPI000EF853A5|nr:MULTISPECIES: DUF2110 family protein [Halostella]NHN49967.1 DUF2110 family protein [Halostella sp. JP-L12]